MHYVDAKMFCNSKKVCILVELIEFPLHSFPRRTINLCRTLMNDQLYMYSTNSILTVLLTKQVNIMAYCMTSSSPPLVLSATIDKANYINSYSTERKSGRYSRQCSCRDRLSYDYATHFTYDKLMNHRKDQSVCTYYLIFIVPYYSACNMSSLMSTFFLINLL